MKALKKDTAAKYDVILLSPRNYFLYTPLLPAVATGTMEERSIVEPIRNVVNGKGEYYEAVCQSIDPKARTLIACFPKDAGFPEACFQMGYDHLIVSVGSVNNTFGVKGVKEYCLFFKGIDDANKLRSQLSECFERSALPYTPVEVCPHWLVAACICCSFSSVSSNGMGSTALATLDFQHAWALAGFQVASTRVRRTQCTPCMYGILLEGMAGALSMTSFAGRF
jgi:hypothetical protein